MEEKGGERESVLWGGIGTRERAGIDDHEPHDLWRARSQLCECFDLFSCALCVSSTSATGDHGVAKNEKNEKREKKTKNNARRKGKGAGSVRGWGGTLWHPLDAIP